MESDLSGGRAFRIRALNMIMMMMMMLIALKNGHVVVCRAFAGGVRI